jgi:hypothetical protein
MIPAGRPIPESYWVIPGRFLAGEYPGGFDEQAARGRIGAFLEAGFQTFIDLTGPGELPAYFPLLEAGADARGLAIQHLRFPITDHGLPAPGQMSAILDAIDAALAAGEKVYLHCWGGVGRTGMTVGCYLIRHGSSGPEALDQLAEWWQPIRKRAVYPRSPETDAQVNFIREWTEPAPPPPKGRGRKAK